MKRIQHTADVCVIGGGLAGMCAAIAAARHGSKVVLIHDRPVLGGNCSSEIRMWPLGAHGSNTRETGIFEEIVLENMRRNPYRTYPIWDSVLFDIVHKQPNLTLILNCSVQNAEIDSWKPENTEDAKTKIISVTGWQLTTYQYHTVAASIFIDCSGDSILADLTEAKYRKGREARGEFGEEAAPESADRQTMGNSCMLQARETETTVTYIAPSFARKISEEEMTGRNHDMTNLRANNFWWLELGGDRETLGECEEIRDDLVALSYGVWDHIKNDPGHEAERWDLDFAGWLPGKRESRRYVGPHILTQNEVADGGHFEDIVAYGGWKIDDHPPKGFDNFAVPTRYFDCPSPFGIPYGCLYSVNVTNLMFAGRNISCTHAAMAASRVMATCAILGQAAGTAAHLAVEKDSDPSLVDVSKLQQILMDDDCWIPGKTREIFEICREAELLITPSESSSEKTLSEEPALDILRNGKDRPEDGEDNGIVVQLGSNITYSLKTAGYVHQLRLILDSDLDRTTVSGEGTIKDCPTICNRPLHMEPFGFPTTMLADFDIQVDGTTICEVRGNRQRLVVIPVERNASTLTLIPRGTTGSGNLVHIFSFDFE